MIFLLYFKFLTRFWAARIKSVTDKILQYQCYFIIIFCFNFNHI